MEHHQTERTCALNTLIFCGLIFLTMGDLANARQHPYKAENRDNYAQRGVQAKKPAQPQKNKASDVGPKPAAWCGWWMRTQKGGGPEYNVARNWAKRGLPLSAPEVGAVVVWPHHVGIIVAKADDRRWVVKSGNDSNMVRERARTLDGAIAFRRV